MVQIVLFPIPVDAAKNKTVNFKLQVNQGKKDISEIMTKIYGINVVSINTLVQDPSWRKVAGGKVVRSGKSYKKAIVTFSPTPEDEITQQIQQQQQGSETAEE